MNKTQLRTKLQALRDAGLARRFSSEEHDFLMNILSMHPGFDQKVGCGIAEFFVAPSTGRFPNHCFWLRRVDGTATDWSWNECLKPSTHAQKVYRAARQSVLPQIFAFKDSRPAVACGHEDAKDFHVDHVRPCMNIFAEWMAAQEDVRLQPSRDCDAINRFADPAVEASWQAFHAEHAQLQLLCAHCNLSKGAR